MGPNMTIVLLLSCLESQLCTGKKMNFLSRTLRAHETVKLSMGVQNKILTLCSSWQATRLQVNASAVGYAEDWS
jgi:hypothetical protein